MAYTRIKICGITRPEDAAIAAAVGADAIGLNFIAGPRKITFEQAATILAELPPLVSVVGLVGDPNLVRSSKPADMALPKKVMAQVNYVQIYETLARMSAVFNTLCWHLISKQCFWPVFRIATRDDVRELPKSLCLYEVQPGALVLDTAVKGQLGGTGQTFDWHWIAEARAAGELDNLPPLILAGGLNPDNVAEAVKIAQPYAVDISSGVENPGQPGVKDPIKMRDFIQAVRSVS